jgi:hypothetical protein
MEFRNGFIPPRGFAFATLAQTASLGGYALSDRRQSRIRHDEA